MHTANMPKSACWCVAMPRFPCSKSQTCWERVNRRALAIYRLQFDWPPGNKAMLAANAHLLAAFFDAERIRWIVWSGLIVITISLLILMRTRWGQSNPLRKCVVLSLVAHLLLGIYTTTVRIVTGERGNGDGGGAWQVSLA